MTGPQDDGDRFELVAFCGREMERLEVVPARRWRKWMDATTGRSANRCLPMLLANESGWLLLNPAAFTVTWTGGAQRSDIIVEYDQPVGIRPLAESNFGSGVLTWGIPILFRTPPGFNLLARGPANAPKDGASPLEGLVETDWSVATFTMNWRLTRPDHPVRFEAGEAFCMIVPQRRGELERFRPVYRDLSTSPEVQAGVNAFHARRDDLQKRKFVADFVGPEAEAFDEWEATYFRGRRPDDTGFAEHQTKLRLNQFGDERTAHPGHGAADASPSAGGLELASEDALVTFRVPSEIRFRAFRSGTVVLNLASGQHFELNPVAGRMLELLSGSRTVGETADIIAGQYGQAIAVVQTDVIELSSQLQEVGVLKPSEGRR